MEYTFKDVNEALPVMWHRLMTDDGVIERASRNGRVRESRTPVTTNFRRPWQRVLLMPERDANPIFHVMEAIWMLAGRQDVAFLAHFNPRMREYSDDGVTLVSAYGARWAPVLAEAVEKLRIDGNSRRSYVPIFNSADCFRNGVDLPCNVGVSFYIRDERLDMSVFNRSNDMIWGAYGANYVTFGFLQEFVAVQLGVQIGTYSQISSCFHMYPDFDVAKRMAPVMPSSPVDPYLLHRLQPCDHAVISTDAITWQADAAAFMHDVEASIELKRPKLVTHYDNPFFSAVAAPMFQGWAAWKFGRSHLRASEYFAGIDAPDWRLGCQQWLRARVAAQAARS